MTLVESFSDTSFASDEWKPSGEAWTIFNEFRRQGIFCDVVLRVDGARFPVHRLVLCACSDYFRSLFLGGWKSSDKQEVEIPGVSPAMMASLIEFAYAGQVIINAQNVQELLSAADQFQVLWFFCDKLKKVATDFILHNFEDMSKISPEFLQLSFNDMHRLITDDRLNVRDEEIVCEAIFRWVRGDKENRIMHLPQLLSNARLGLLEPKYFISKVKANELVMERMSDCRDLVSQAMRFVCDLHSPESDVSTSGGTSLPSKLLRRRLPNEILLAVGGWSGGCSTNAIEAYDPRAETWVDISSMPGLSEERPRAYHGVAYLNKCIFIIGGFDGINYFNTVRKFSLAKSQWVQETSMFHKRCYVSVTKLDGKIYALGGMDGEHRLNTGEVYDPVQRVWTILPEMNERRSDASAAALDNRVYIAGGFNGQECLFTAEFYDPNLLSWTRITPMRSKRSGVSLIAFQGMVYAVGGFDGINRLRSAEAYSPTTNTWKTISTMNKPRSNFGMDVIDNQIIAVGGFNGHRTSSDVEVYDITTNEWYEVREMHILRSALSCCVMDKLPHSVLSRFCLSRELNTAAGRGNVHTTITQDAPRRQVSTTAVEIHRNETNEDD